MQKFTYLFLGLLSIPVMADRSVSFIQSLAYANPGAWRADINIANISSPTAAPLGIKLSGSIWSLNPTGVTDLLIGIGIPFVSCSDAGGCTPDALGYYPLSSGGTMWFKGEKLNAIGTNFYVSSKILVKGDFGAIMATGSIVVNGGGPDRTVPIVINGNRPF